MRFFITTIFLTCLTLTGWSQQKPFVVVFNDGLYNNDSIVKGTLDNSAFRMKVLNLRNALFTEGHLLANIDQADFSDSLYAEIYIGKKYYWHSLGLQNIPEEYLSKSGYRENDFTNTEVNPRDFKRFVNRLLDQATNSGYPFASFKLADITIQSTAVRGRLDLTSGPLIKFDSLTIEPAQLIKAEFLESYLGIVRDELFNMDQVLQIDDAVNRLKFVKLADSVKFKFENNLCNVYLHLEPVKSNKFDAIIGFLPNQSSAGGLRITGYADLHLTNLFRSGKSLNFKWQQFQNASQRLDLSYRQPNLLGSRLGFSMQGNLLKQDTTFLNANLLIDFFYTKNAFEISLSSNFVTARQLSTPLDTSKIPLVGDYNMNLFGLGLAYDNIGNPLNPRRGWRLATSVNLGGKNIRKNPSLPEAIYDSLMLKTKQLQLGVVSALNIPLGRLLVIHSELQAGTVLNNDRLFINDLMRIGGLNSLRGFNDLDLYVSSYAMIRFETRLLMNEYSRIFVFYDQAITMNSINSFADTPLGFGAGLFLNTGAGNLQLVYALGVSQEQSLSLGQSKIHLGYVATF